MSAPNSHPHERDWMFPRRFATPALLSTALMFIAVAALWPSESAALPLFARQTGQNCQACHQGGQFPELTQYGRLFKLTGYTIGQHTVPLSAMAVVSESRVFNTAKSDDPKADFAKNSSLIFATSSIFLGGKVTNNIGAFLQVTYDNYAAQSEDGKWH